MTEKFQVGYLHPPPPPHHEKQMPFKIPNLSILVEHFENCACVCKQYEQLQTFKYSFSCGMFIGNYACVMAF